MSNMGMPRRPARTSQREPERRHRAELRPVSAAATVLDPPRPLRLHPDRRKLSVPIATVVHDDHETWISILRHTEGRPPLLSIGRFVDGERRAFVVLDEADLDAIEDGVRAYRNLLRTAEPA